MTWNGPAFRPSPHAGSGSGATSRIWCSATLGVMVLFLALFS
jgi:hypothetical protein